MARTSHPFLAKGALAALLALPLLLAACGGADSPGNTTPGDGSNPSTPGSGSVGASSPDGAASSSPPEPGASTPTTTPAQPTPVDLSGRPKPNWAAFEAPQPWDYQAVYPSRTACADGEGDTFHVGPGQAYAALKDVPWLKLLPCDNVHIHPSPKPYKDIIFIGARGAANKWITIRGIPDAQGRRPILDGDGAVMPKDTGANQWTDTAGMIIVSKPDGSVAPRSGEYKTGYLHITGLHIRNARPPFQATRLTGQASSWGRFSAGIVVNGGEQIAVTNCELADNGLGLFANSGGGEFGQTRRLLVARNYFHGNSNPGSFSEHNAYTEGVGTIYEYNYFGPILDGSYGDNIKERSAGVVFRYNYIDGGADLIALRDPESNADHEAIQTDAWGEKLVASAYIYGNILASKGYLQSYIGHGDGPGNPQVREGILYFYNNRVVSQTDQDGWWWNGQYDESQSVMLFNLLNTRSPAKVVARNNLFHIRSLTPGKPAPTFALFLWQGQADFQSNWINRFDKVGFSSTGGTLANGAAFDGTGLGGLLADERTDPGFVDMASGNYLTTAASPYASLRAPYPEAVIRRKLQATAEPVIKPFQP